MIKAVVFDYGGVVTSGGGGNELAERFASYENISLERAKEVVYKPWPDFIIGKITEEDYWHRLESDLGHQIPAAHKHIWNTWEHMSPRPEMIEFIDSLKTDGYIVGLLSNVIPITEKIIRDHGGYETFNPCVLSCSVGMAKPDVEIYKYLTGQLPGVKPEEVVFVDDQQRCLNPAQKLGMQTVLALNSSQIISDVKSLL